MCLSTQEYILNIKQVLKGYQDPIVQEMKTTPSLRFRYLCICALYPTQSCSVHSHMSDSY